MKAVVAALSLSLVTVVAAPVRAAPSCKKYFEPGSPGEKLLSCKFRGGVRPTRELGGKKYITVVGTCYDYDVVALQKCGCRQFDRASLCCGKGRAAKTCYWRVGNSHLVDCKKYGKPKFGLTGNTETEECRQTVNAADCFKKVRNQALVTAGPCEHLRLDCKGDKEKAGSDFFNEKCGPLVEDCGCSVDRTCSPSAAVQCYDEYSKDKEGIACFWKQDKSLYDKKQCYEAVKKKRGK